MLIVNLRCANNAYNLAKSVYLIHNVHLVFKLIIYTKMIACYNALMDFMNKIKIVINVI